VRGLGEIVEDASREMKYLFNELNNKNEALKKELTEIKARVGDVQSGKISELHKARQ
jgi:cell shape-determining protein MreC